MRMCSAPMPPRDPGTGELIVPIRLQRFLARAGVASRRGSEDLMTAGRVTVNGAVASGLGCKVDPSRDEVRVDGNLVTWGSAPVTLVLNKPAGYLTSMSDPFGRPCVSCPATGIPGSFQSDAWTSIPRGCSSSAPTAILVKGSCIPLGMYGKPTGRSATGACATVSWRSCDGASCSMTAPASPPAAGSSTQARSPVSGAHGFPSSALLLRCAFAKVARTRSSACSDASIIR